MSNIRSTAVAGMFYPAEAQQLRDQVSSLLAQADDQGCIPKAIIAPHAGYIYSGPVAASVYARLARVRDVIRRVVLLGPSHRVTFQGLAVSSAEAYDSPLGPVPVDTGLVNSLLALPQVQVLDEAHRQEHSLEVHLPFLQTVLDYFELVPLVVGDARPEAVAEVLDLMWGGPETLIVISSDLSHYHDYDTAQGLDRATSRAIEELRPEAIGYDNACGRNPVNGLLLSARQRGMQAQTIDLRNSGDTAGDRRRVVGYGAYVFH